MKRKNWKFNKGGKPRKGFKRLEIRKDRRRLKRHMKRITVHGK